MSHDEVSDAEIEAIRSALHDLFVELDIGDFAAKSWARAAILAYRTALRVHGLKIVAREPTEAMTEIGIDIWCNLPGTDDHQVRSNWRAMWDVAPEES